MNLHSDWMKSNRLGSDLDKKNNNLIQKAKNRFDVQRFDSYEGYSVKIDGIVEQVVIQEHSNPLNQNKIDKKLFCEILSKVKCGSICEFNNRIFLVVSKPESNLAYLKSKIIECNHILKWYDNESILIQENCILDSTLSNLDESRTMILPDNQRTIVLQNNYSTDALTYDQRFIFNKMAWKIINFDRVFRPGLVTLTVQQHQIDTSKDDLVNEIANANNTTNPSVWA